MAFMSFYIIFDTSVFFEVIGKLKIEGKITIEVSVRGRNAITHFLFGC
jgi:hypothetical protein